MIRIVTRLDRADLLETRTRTDQTALSNLKKFARHVASDQRKNHGNKSVTYHILWKYFYATVQENGLLIQEYFDKWLKCEFDRNLSNGCSETWYMYKARCRWFERWGIQASQATLKAINLKKEECARIKTDAASKLAHSKSQQFEMIDEKLPGALEFLAKVTQEEFLERCAAIMDDKDTSETVRRNLGVLTKCHWKREVWPYLLMCRAAITISSQTGVRFVGLWKLDSAQAIRIKDGDEPCLRLDYKTGKCGRSKETYRTKYVRAVPHVRPECDALINFAQYMHVAKNPAYPFQFLFSTRRRENARSDSEQAEDNRYRKAHERMCAVVKLAFNAAGHKGSFGQKVFHAFRFYATNVLRRGSVQVCHRFDHLGWDRKDIESISYTDTATLTENNPAAFVASGRLTHSVTAGEKKDVTFGPASLWDYYGETKKYVDSTMARVVFLSAAARICPFKIDVPVAFEHVVSQHGRNNTAVSQTGRAAVAALQDQVRTLKVTNQELRQATSSSSSSAVNPAYARGEIERIFSEALEHNDGDIEEFPKTCLRVISTRIAPLLDAHGKADATHASGLGVNLDMNKVGRHLLTAMRLAILAKERVAPPNTGGKSWFVWGKSNAKVLKGLTGVKSSNWLNLREKIVG